MFKRRIGGVVVVGERAKKKTLFTQEKNLLLDDNKG
jgi:hypothetical protein